MNDSGDLVPDPDCMSTSSMMSTASTMNSTSQPLSTETSKEKGTSVAIAIGTSAAILVVLIIAAASLVVIMLMWRTHKLHREKVVGKDPMSSEMYVSLN